MSAYSRDSLSIEAYLVRIIAALCRQNGGTLRVKGEMVDMVGDATALLKSWDSTTQELVLTVNMGTFGEVYRVVPERQLKGPVAIDTAAPEVGARAANGSIPLPSSSLDDAQLAEMERRLTKARMARMLRAELNERARERSNAQGTT